MPSFSRTARRAALAAAVFTSVGSTFKQDARTRKKFSEKAGATFDWRQWEEAKAARGENVGDAKGAPLQIHVLSHSHDDPGWIRTSDQYYEQFVRHMYDTVNGALEANHARKFQVVEQVYFNQWYDDARTTGDMRQAAHRQVEAGQIEFAVGGWVMPDEAITDYPDIIDTMSAGHEYIVNLFGEDAAPRFGFQVDPFGASSAFAALSAKMGFNGHLVARLNYYDKGWMQDNKQLEFVWRPDEAMHKADGLEIFTHIMDQYQYTSPYLPVEDQLNYLCAPPLNRSDCPGGNFLWDGDDSQPASYWEQQAQELGYNVYPLVNASNVQFYSDFLVNNSRQRQEWFATENVLWPHGTDFQFFNATAMYDSMDQIVEHVSANSGGGGRYEGVKIQYSMLSDYFSAVHESGRSDGDAWRVRSPEEGDFLPYSTINCAGASQGFSGSCSGDAGPQFNVSWPQTWSGFYTSHTGLKIDQRKHAAKLRGAQALAAFTSRTPEVHAGLTEASSALSRSVTKLQHSVGLLTHHDAVSGTMGPGCGNGDGPNCTFGQEMGSPNNFGTVDMDYRTRLDSQWQETVSYLEWAANSLLARGQASQPSFSVDSGDFDASLASGQSASIAVQNLLSQHMVRWMKVLLPASWTDQQTAIVTGTDGEAVPTEILQAGALACADAAGAGAEVECAAQDNVLERDTTRKVLWFRARVPPLGLSSYVVTPQAGTPGRLASSEGVRVSQGDVKIRNAFFELTFDAGRGALKAVRDLVAGVDVQLEQSLQQYTSFDKVENRTSGDEWSLSYLGGRSGSYLMHPGEADPVPVVPRASSSDPLGYPHLLLLEGVNGHVTELRQRLTHTETQVWRIFDDDDVGAAGYIQMHLGIGPLGPNKEIVSHFKTNISTDQAGDGSVFFSDNNGLSMLRRKFSAERSFPDGTSATVAPDPTYTTSLNYYPIVRSAFIADDAGHQLTLIVPQSGGVTSRGDGELEVMLHRRSVQDDAKGACGVYNDTTGQPAELPEDPSMGTTCSNFANAGTCRADGCPAFSIPMNISDRIEPEIWIVAGHADSSQARRPSFAQAVNNPPTMLYSGTTVGGGVTFAPLGSGASLPAGIHALTLRPRFQYSNSQGGAPLVLRLQHIDPDSADEAVVVNFEAAGLCTALGEESLVEERTLTNLFPLAGPKARPRWSWRTSDADSGTAQKVAPSTVAGGPTPCSRTEVRIAPGDIRTFQIAAPEAPLFV